ncbi:MAG: ketopantoate reductase C-terminal domain-containing protein [Pirellulaceae bacterium]
MQPAEDLLKVRWSKLVWNIPYNGLSVVLNADTRQLMHDSASATLVEDLMREVCEAASRCGCSIDEAHVTKMLEDTRRMVPYDSSMRLDFLAAAHGGRSHFWQSATCGVASRLSTVQNRDALSAIVLFESKHRLNRPVQD